MLPPPSALQLGLRGDVRRNQAAAASSGSRAASLPIGVRRTAVTTASAANHGSSSLPRAARSLHARSSAPAPAGLPATSNARPGACARDATSSARSLQLLRQAMCAAPARTSARSRALAASLRKLASVMVPARFRLLELAHACVRSGRAGAPAQPRSCPSASRIAAPSQRAATGERPARPWPSDASVWRSCRSRTAIDDTHRFLSWLKGTKVSFRCDAISSLTTAPATRTNSAHQRPARSAAGTCLAKPASMDAVTALPPAAVEIVALTKRYAAGTPAAVDQIDLRIASGSYCCLLGPSGCGKSTTLRMVAGHESVSSGDILLDNRNITNLPAAARGTAMMFQSFALFPHLSALDNVAFSLKMKGVSKAERHQRARRPARARRHGPPGAAQAGRALGRPAAARGAGARPDHRAARAAARRAAVGARPLPAHPDARRAAPLAEGTGPDLHPRHALAGRGDGAGRHHGGDEPRADRAGRLAARGLQPPGQRVRGALHGRPQRAADARPARSRCATTTCRSRRRRSRRRAACAATSPTSSTRAPTCCWACALDGRAARSAAASRCCCTRAGLPGAQPYARRRQRAPVVGRGRRARARPRRHAPGRQARAARQEPASRLAAMAA